MGLFAIEAVDSALRALDISPEEADRIRGRVRDRYGDSIEYWLVTSDPGVRLIEINGERFPNHSVRAYGRALIEAVREG